MSKKVFKKGEGTSIVSVIGDEDTVTGFLLTGIGERNIKGETNFLVVDSGIFGFICRKFTKNYIKRNRE